ncbi:hypothetical protein CRENBAI_013079 [Crenichthys baileyi]|uniref:DUF6729 domain-containing protein n=1 Tax=Crenichthys baileyi TaxID=28760 RepID=A0AAV9QPU1_9TELE
MTESLNKVNLLTFVKYALSFKDIQDALKYDASRDTVATTSEDDQLVGFGSRAKSTWKEIWDAREDGYADFILKKSCLPGTRMKKLQQYLLKRHQLSSSPPTPTSTVPHKPLVMEEDEELEAAMLSISPSKLLSKSRSAEKEGSPVPKSSSRAKTGPTATVSRSSAASGEPESSIADVLAITQKTPVALPSQLSFLVEMKETASAKKSDSFKDSSTSATSSSSVQRSLSFSDSAEDAQPPIAVPQPQREHDMNSWNCSQHQKLWMRTEMQDLGLWPGSRAVRNLGNAISLWRHPPQPELIDTVAELPSPNFFQLHPFFIWKPENEIMSRLKNNYNLPCLHGCPHPQVVSAGVGRPRVIVGTSGQYYILSSRLCCKSCRKNWFADSPRWLEKLPRRFINLLPAFLTYKKAICKSVMDELRRTGKSPTDMANQVNELMHLKYERAHLAYLQAIESVWDAEAGVHGQKTIGHFIRKSNTPYPFSSYEDPNGWCGISVSGFYLTDCLLEEYKHQEPALLRLLQGTFGQVFRSDHTRKVARKVTLASGIMSNYAIMNEHWLIVSWVMVQSESERSLEPMYQGMAKRYNDAGVEKAGFHWVDSAFQGVQKLNITRFSALSDSSSLLLSLWGIRISKEAQGGPMSSVVLYQPNPNQPAHPGALRDQDTTAHRATGQSGEKIKLFLSKDPNDVPFVQTSMLKTWRIQRVHILRGCLSDPKLSESIMYRYVGTLQLNHVPGEGAKVPQLDSCRLHHSRKVTISIRPSGSLETWSPLSCSKTQGMTGLGLGNYQRLVDLKQPGVVLPAVFDPALIAELNTFSKRVTGQEKYPTLQISNRDTGERFGLEHVQTADVTLSSSLAVPVSSLSSTEFQKQEILSEILQDSQRVFQRLHILCDPHQGVHELNLKRPVDVFFYWIIR